MHNFKDDNYYQYKKDNKSQLDNFLFEIEDLRAAKKLLIEILGYWNMWKEEISNNEFNKNKELQKKIFRYLKIPLEGEDMRSEELEVEPTIDYSKIPTKL